jgi:hypothetical protein
MPWLKSQNVPCQFETPLGAAGETAPHDDILLDDAGFDDALVTLAALEADRARRVVGSID